LFVVTTDWYVDQFSVTVTEVSVPSEELNWGTASVVAQLVSASACTLDVCCRVVCADEKTVVAKAAATNVLVNTLRSALKQGFKSASFPNLDLWK